MGRLMKITKRRLFIYWAVLLLLGLAVGLYPCLPVGPSIRNARGIQKGTVRAEIQATYGRPVSTYAYPDGRSFARWELSGGWADIGFDEHDCVQWCIVVPQGWLDRKMRRLGRAIGW
jgi:hypothetical protein